MGRHSAPETDSEELFDGAAGAMAVPAVSRGRHAAPEQSTASDYALLRAHGDVRAWVIAAALVPFVLYTSAMAAVGKLDRAYLLWVWIPLITAGVCVGLFLDLGHRKYER